MSELKLCPHCGNTNLDENGLALPQPITAETARRVVKALVELPDTDDLESIAQCANVEVNHEG